MRIYTQEDFPVMRKLLCFLHVASPVFSVFQSFRDESLNNSCFPVERQVGHFFLISSIASLPVKCSMSSKGISICDSPFPNSFWNPTSSTGLYLSPNKGTAHILSLSDSMI